MATDTANSEAKEKYLNLSALAPNPGSRRPRKRLGIGEGSGKGKTAGKGHKGQRARSGYKAVRGFEGGQMPIHRRLPKIGFASRKKLRKENVFCLISLSKLEELAGGGDVTMARLIETGIVRNKNERIKLLGSGELKAKVVVEAHKASASAKAAIEAAGGEIRFL